ncbi:hypothetical protein B0A69_00285 [Chryseobacterium shigense]|uniref:Uncharacterized protein n=1 Tax=Chryseobacterium shigense TaxID=297244 RepID=A0A1N7I062_9FLAO|nr:hypothetical protein [Chryseobacterium shigense]PQA97811.1 hypothetical protein B0A69_00285 [Chryseobacterium shigense]SIS30459.1 hypothetical protein SAMN05421639_101918 [Chryseobacterium shigense]
MKKKLIILFIFLLIANFSYSQHISGNYLSFASKCKIYLKIDNNNSFVSELGKGKKIEGIVKLFKEDKNTYLDFSGNISAMFNNDTISIQNSGNSKNPYVHFKECNCLFIWLKKAI